MSFTEQHNAMNGLLAASIAHHDAESAVFAAKRTGDGNVSQDLITALDKASVDLRSASRIYASLQKKIASQKMILDGFAQ